MRDAERRIHEQTEQWVNQVEDGEALDAFGITRKSVFFRAPGFDVIQDLMPERMYLLDAGLWKNTMSRIFQSGASQQTRPGYWRQNIGQLTSLIR